MSKSDMRAVAASKVVSVETVRQPLVPVAMVGVRAMRVVLKAGSGRVRSRL